MKPFAVCALLLVTACVHRPAPVLDAHLYTYDGQVFTAHFQGNPDGRGQVWGTLPDGEEFQGEYFTVFNREQTVSSYNTPWGPLRGVSASEIGPQITHVTAVGNKGTSMQCLTYPCGYHGFGSCRDSRHRDYRLHY